MGEGIGRRSGLVSRHLTTAPLLFSLPPTTDALTEKREKSTSTGTALKCALKFPPYFDPSDFGSRNGFVNKKLLSIIVPPNVHLIPRAVRWVINYSCSTDLPRRSKRCFCKSGKHNIIYCHRFSTSTFNIRPKYNLFGPV